MVDIKYKDSLIDIDQAQGFGLPKDLEDLYANTYDLSFEFWSTSAKLGITDQGWQVSHETIKRNSGKLQE